MHVYGLGSEPLHLITESLPFALRQTLSPLAETSAPDRGRWRLLEAFSIFFDAEDHSN